MNRQQQHQPNETDETKPREKKRKKLWKKRNSGSGREYDSCRLCLAGRHSFRWPGDVSCAKCAHACEQCFFFCFFYFWLLLLLLFARHGRCRVCVQRLISSRQVISCMTFCALTLSRSRFASAGTWSSFWILFRLLGIFFFVFRFCFYSCWPVHYEQLAKATTTTTITSTRVPCLFLPLLFAGPRQYVPLRHKWMGAIKKIVLCQIMVRVPCNLFSTGSKTTT